mmetsp:Transcript_2318/g.4290  ORF Transcript_2318/g.4290 Transcript_2318/m.4290 type:complete len:289 (+) Transcript_2318:851-1717(+)
MTLGQMDPRAQEEAVPSGDQPAPSALSRDSWAGTPSRDTVENTAIVVPYCVSECSSDRRSCIGRSIRRCGARSTGRPSWAGAQHQRRVLAPSTGAVRPLNNGRTGLVVDALQDQGVRDRAVGGIVDDVASLPVHPRCLGKVDCLGVGGGTAHCGTCPALPAAGALFHGLAAGDGLSHFRDIHLRHLETRGGGVVGGCQLAHLSLGGGRGHRGERGESQFVVDFLDLDDLTFAVFNVAFEIRSLVLNLRSQKRIELSPTLLHSHHVPRGHIQIGEVNVVLLVVRAVTPV